MSDKIKAHHLERKAMLYVRQSSAYQVAHNRESRELQYAMQARLRELGWPEVELVDEDLGRSASGTTKRSGFERMVAEVSLGRVGAVAAWEVSRFARNSREWQQLVEICRVVDAVLIDQDAVYTPQVSNDRLLLGLKGSLNEYELDLFRERSVQARREKARRGELLVIAPIGYRKTEEQRLEKDPDRRVRQAIELVFEKFLQIGTVRQTLMWFFDQGLKLPARKPAGETYWRRPAYGNVYSILTNPVYGGAYAYGKTEAVSQYEDGEVKRGFRRKARDRWLALIPDSHEGYIEWSRFEQVQRMISENVVGSGGARAPKGGAALLAGLLRCRRCGRKLVVRYTGSGRDMLRYCCERGWLDNGEPTCIAFGGKRVDEAIGREVLRVVEPAATQAAVLAQRQATAAGEEVLQALQRDLEAAQYAANRAFKQYDAADPENRLVTDELERRWNQALEQVRDIQRRMEQHEREVQPSTPRRLRDFDDLARDLPAVWNSPDTDSRLKKRIIRTLIKEIVVDIDAEASEVVVIVHWQGDVHTELRVVRRRRGQSGSHTARPIVGAVRMLVRLCPDAVIAGVLNRNGLRTGRGNRWTRERVTALRSYHKIPCHCPEQRQTEGWMTLSEAARVLHVAPKTLRLAVERGEVQGEHPLPDGPWIFKREALQTEAATALTARARRQAPALPPPGQGDLQFSST
jgi:DNA invertase Pin-like site-specific DNA recombinase